MASEINEVDLIQVLRDQLVQESDVKALSFRQLRRKTGFSVKRLREMLWDLKEAGKVEIVKQPYTDIAGVQKAIVAYKLVEEDGI